MTGTQISTRLCLILIACFVCADAQTFRFATMSWTSCYPVAGTAQNGFYDHLFPDVCSDRTNPYRVAVTIKTTFAIQGNSQTNMLQTALQDVANYKAGKSKTLYVYRMKSDPTVERRIGYRFGVGDPSYNPVIVDCPVAPCPPSYNFNMYAFQIDRLSIDGTLVHARFTYEISVPAFGDYTAFFEGCCRPPQTAINPDLDVSNAQGLFVTNNYNLPFHLRTDIRLSSSPDTALSSVRFNMPDMVVLRKGGLSPRACNSPCLSSCSLRFQLQAYHPDDRFQGSVQFQLASPNEYGQYKCLEHLGSNGAVLTDPSASTTTLSTYSARCVSGMRVPQNPSVFGFNVGLGGEVTFGVDVAGIWQVTIMAVCKKCFGGADGSTPLDLLIRVQDSSSDPNPPISIYNSSMVAGLTPATSRSEPVTITCGRPGFSLGAATFSSLRVAFADPDDGLAVKCISSPNSIDAVGQVNDLPWGLIVSPTARVPSTSIGYVEINWMPQCEDVSQVGLFMLCFYAKDAATTAGFQPLVSMPSPISSSVATSSCVYVRSLPPPFNPSPQFASVPLPLTAPPACSGGCCSCCGQVSCACASIPSVTCCDKIYAQAGAVKALDFRAVDEDTLEELAIQFTFPEGGPAGGLPRGVGMPAPRPFKYGCGGNAYGPCFDSGHPRYDVSTQLRWDLTNMSDFFCSASGVPCQGANTPCATAGDVCQQRQLAQKSIAPFKVCFQAQQLVADSVDQFLYQRVYGFTVANFSCLSCFVVSVLSPPFFITLNANNGGTPNDQQSFYLAVGEALSINLLGGSINVGMAVTTVLLADPGAPNGAALTPVQTVFAAGVAQDLGYLRRFLFTPTLDQRGTSYRVCFQVVDASLEASPARCFYIYVLEVQTTWTVSPCPTSLQPSTPSRLLAPGGASQPADCMPCVLDPAPAGAASTSGSCPTETAADVSVGCTYSLAITALAPRYQLQVVLQELPHCNECSGALAGAAVLACGVAGLDPAAPCCGNGVCDGLESGHGCPADCGAETASLVNKGLGGVAMQTAEFQWRPGPAHEGRSVLTCFQAVVPGLGLAAHAARPAAPAAPALCVLFRVRRCVYCVPRGATLLSVARRLRVGWHSLYNANPAVHNPSLLLQQSALVLGPIYVVQEKDTLMSVAAMARTTVRGILERNRDLDVSAGLAVGQELCLLVCSDASSTATAA